MHWKTNLIMQMCYQIIAKVFQEFANPFTVINLFLAFNTLHVLLEGVDPRGEFSMLLEIVVHVDFCL